MSAAAAGLCVEALSPAGVRVRAHVGTASPAEAAGALEAASAAPQLEAFTRSYLLGDLEDGEPLQFTHAGRAGRPVAVTVVAPTVLTGVEGLRALGSSKLLAEVMALPAAS